MPTLFVSAFPTTAEQYLRQLEKFAVHKKSHPNLELYTYMLPVEDRLIDAVLSAEEPLAAAQSLLTRVADMWD